MKKEKTGNDLGLWKNGQAHWAKPPLELKHLVDKYKEGAPMRKAHAAALLDSQRKYLVKWQSCR